MDKSGPSKNAPSCQAHVGKTRPFRVVCPAIHLKGALSFPVAGPTQQHSAFDELRAKAGESGANPANIASMEVAIGSPEVVSRPKTMLVENTRHCKKCIQFELVY
jgi:hypothetical protein